MSPTSDLRATVRASVLARRPVDAREADSIGEVLHGLDSLPTPFDEHAGPVHVTGSAIVVGPRGVLLHRHKRLGIWLQPGGHVDAGEAPWDGARRETLEETGLDAVHAHGRPTLVHVDAHPGPRGHTHLDLRYLFVADGDPAPPAGESQDVAWFGWDAAIERADDGLAGLLRALRPADLGAVVIRPSSPADGAAVGEIYLRSFRWALPAITLAHDDADVRRHFAGLAAQDTTWIAEVAGVAVGFLVIEGDFVAHLYLDPPWTGRGIGGVLLERARQVRPAGFQLWTFQANAAARRFYAAQGLREVELTDGAGNEERAPDVRLVWPG